MAFACIKLDVWLLDEPPSAAGADAADMVFCAGWLPALRSSGANVNVR